MAWERSWQWGSGGAVSAVFEALRRRLNRWLVGWLFEGAALNAQSHVLEGGSGSAFASQLFARRLSGGLSVALDSDGQALASVARGKEAAAVQADLCHIPFLPGSFDLVWNSSTLEHLPDPSAALGEMARVAKPGGLIFVGVPYRYGPFVFEPLIRTTAFGRWVGPVFDRKKLLELIRSSGLEPVRMRTYAYKCFLGVMARKAVSKAAI